MAVSGPRATRVPAINAGTDSTGSASAVPIWSGVEVVRPAAACPPSRPASRSSATLCGVAAPGTTRPRAFPAITALETLNQSS